MSVRDMVNCIQNTEEHWIWKYESCKFVLFYLQYQHRDINSQVIVHTQEGLFFGGLSNAPT